MTWSPPESRERFGVDVVEHMQRKITIRWP